MWLWPCVCEGAPMQCSEQSQVQLDARDAMGVSLRGCAQCWVALSIAQGCDPPRPLWQGQTGQPSASCRLGGAAGGSSVLEPCGKRAGSQKDISQFYCTWPCDLTLSTPEKGIYFFSLVRKGTRRNSVRADLGGSGVKSFSCS